MADIKKLVPKADMINVDSGVSPITYTPEQTAYTYDPTVAKEPVKEAAARVQYLASPVPQYTVQPVQFEQPVQPQQTRPVYKPVVINNPKVVNPINASNDPSILNALKTVNIVKNAAKEVSEKPIEKPAEAPVVVVDPNALNTSDTVKDTNKEIPKNSPGIIRGYLNDDRSLLGTLLSDIGDSFKSAYILGKDYLNFNTSPEDTVKHLKDLKHDREESNKKWGNWWNDRTENPSHFGYDAFDIGTFWVPYATGAKIAGAGAKTIKLGKAGTTAATISGGLAADTGFGSVKEATKKYYEDN